MGVKGERIPEAKREWILRLRARRMSIRRIAGITRISPSSVARICAGSGNPEPHLSRPLGRCPRCGRLVRLPCYACYLETAPEAVRQRWREQARKLEAEAMDLIQELSDLKQAVRDALEDGRLSLREVVRIAREAADVLEILMPILVGQINRLDSQIQQKE